MKRLLILALLLSPSPFLATQHTAEAKTVETGRQMLRLSDADPIQAKIIAFARSLRGIRYRYASANPKTGFDCSGFIHYVFRNFQITVPRSSAAFAEAGKPIDLKNAGPGDLILFTGTNSQIRSIGHTVMSLNNLLAYLNGWGQLVLKWVDKTDKGETVDFPETGYKWNELGSLAQKFYADYETDSYSSLCKKLDDTVASVLQLIDAKTNEQLYVDTWYKQWTLGRMIQFNTSSPYDNATKRIRKWKKIRTQLEKQS